MSYIHNFESKVLARRRLLLDDTMTYTMTYTFDITVPLSQTDANDAETLSEEFLSNLDAGSDFAQDVYDTLSDVTAIDEVTAVVVTRSPTNSPTYSRSPTFSPTRSPTITDDDDDDDSSSATATANATVIVLPIMAFIVVASLAYYYFFYHAKKDKRSETNNNSAYPAEYGIEVSESNQSTGIEIEMAPNALTIQDELPSPLGADNEVPSPLGADELGSSRFDADIQSPLPAEITTVGTSTEL